MKIYINHPQTTSFYPVLDVGPVVDGRIDMKSIKTKSVSVGTTVKV